MRAHIRRLADGGSIPPFATKENAITRVVAFFICIMFIVYALDSEKYDKIYIGMTSNLKGRLKSYNELSSKGWTKNFRPWVVFYQEACETKSQALKREKQLKTAAGREFLRGLIAEKRR